MMINHENGHSRPSYFVIEDKDILWFIPLSSKVEKYKKIIEHKINKNGTCKTIMIEKIAGKETAILIQNTFPTIKKYVKNPHTIGNNKVKVIKSIQKKIQKNFNDTMIAKENGRNSFFCDIDKIKEKMLAEINKVDK